jgi:Cys-tRNA(Pro)/Cys-tRNA(Cys) deacylase
VGAQGTRAIDAARRAGVVHAVHEYAHDPRASLREGGRGYALEAVDALGVEPARVCKTIVVIVDGRLALAVIAADGEVDLKAVADALGGRRAEIAPPADAERATGYVLGGISPLGTRRPLPTVLDAAAAAHRTILVSAGRRGLQLELAPADLLALTAGRSAPIARRG